MLAVGKQQWGTKEIDTLENFYALVNFYDQQEK